MVVAGVRSYRFYPALHHFYTHPLLFPADSSVGGRMIRCNSVLFYFHGVSKTHGGELQRQKEVLSN